MKVHLITGATGFVGRYLTRALLGEGEQVWVIIRPSATESAQDRAAQVLGAYIKKWPKTLRVIEGDILSQNLGLTEPVLHELKKYEVVVWHLAANLSFQPSDVVEVQNTNYQGTVATLAFANAFASQFLYMSTAYVCGDSSSLNEDELAKGQHFHNQYERSKFQAEWYVNDHCQVPYLIFRPSIIIGDAYRGKAEGCTFGYYRYMFMFHFLKQQIIKVLQKKTFMSFCFKKLGTSYNKVRDQLTVPWLIIPYPRRALVDLVPVDYVIDSMISLYNNAARNITVHLTHNHPPKFRFLFNIALSDLGYRQAKPVPVPAWLFRSLLQIFHFVAVPMRKYIRSIMWYTPYITKRCRFEHNPSKHGLQSPPIISRMVATKINTYAKEKILDHIVV